MSGEILPTLYDVLGRHQNGSQRSLQTRIGPSEIGVSCQRQLAYKLSGAERINDEPLKWAPLLGTYGHAGIAEAFELDNRRRLLAGLPARWIVEQRVSVDDDLDGVTDLYDLERAEVVDWKLVGKTRLQHYKRHGPGDQYRVQGHTYGRGWSRQGFRVESVRIVFLPRWSHLLTDGWEWSEPYNEGLAVQALQRLAHTRRLVEGLELVRSGRFDLVQATVGDDCRFCPFRRPTTADADATGCPGDSAGALERSRTAFQRGLAPAS